MDPLSVAASIVGLIGAAAKVSSTLNNFIQSAKAAPKIAQRLLTEVIDVSACLGQVQAFLLGVKEIPRSLQSLVMVEEIVVVLSNCVLVFSELEETVDSLKVDQPMQAGRFVRWILKEQSIGALLLRLQSSKMSLSLMISTFTSNSVIEAQTSVDQLAMLVKKVLDSNQEMSRRLASMEMRASGRKSSLASRGLQKNIEDDDQSILTVRPAFSKGNLQRDSRNSTDFATGFAFEMDLQASRPYTRVFGNQEDFSANSSAINTMGWSCLSALSMADVSDISVIGLPVDTSALWNHEHYSIKPPPHTRRHTIPTIIPNDKISQNHNRLSWRGLRRSRLSGFLNRQTSETENIKHVVNATSSSENLVRRKKILLLGAASSGKTTIAKHAQLLHGTDLPREERLQWREKILNEMITAVMDARHNPGFVDPFRDLSRDCTEYFDSLALATQSGQLDPVYSSRCHKPLKVLWENPRVRVVVKEGPNAALNEDISYYMDHIDELFLTPEIVSNSMILNARQMTSGIHRQVINVGNEALEIVDVGGRRLERKKWIHCTDADKIIFVVALAGYSQSLDEDNTVCHMHEELMIFKSVVNHEKFSKLPIILIFNMVDLLFNNLRRFPIKSTFPEYVGDDDAISAIKFFEEKFRQQDNRPLTVKRLMPLEFHVTAATDPECFQATMKAIHPFLTNDGTRQRERIDKGAISKPIFISSTHPGS